MVEKGKDEKEIHVGKFIAWGIFLAVILITVGGSWFTVDAGQRAVLLRFGAVQGEYGEGFHFKAPIIDNPVYFDSRVVKTDVNAAAYSKDAQIIDMNLSINYRIGKSATEIYRNIGVNYPNTVIAPAIQDSVKKVLATYDAQSLLDGYANASRAINEDLYNRLAPFGITVVGVNIVNHDYSSAFEAAVEAKQLSVQAALKAENDLRTIEVQAKQQIASANATAESQILKGKADASYSLSAKNAEAEGNLAIAKSQAQGKLLIAQAEAEALRLQKEQLSAQILELRTIEVQKEYATHWNGALPKTMMGSTPIPFLNLPSSMVDTE